MTLTLTGELGTGRGPLDARMILLPLLDDRGAVTRLLGALEAQGRIGRQPRRFAILEQQTDRPCPQPATAAAPDSGHVPGLAEAPATWDARSGGRPSLHVVQRPPPKDGGPDDTGGPAGPGPAT